jgi:hypothetical protein
MLLISSSRPATALTAARVSTRRHIRRIVIINVIVVIDGMPFSFLCEAQVGQEGLDAQG